VDSYREILVGQEEREEGEEGDECLCGQPRIMLLEATVIWCVPVPLRSDDWPGRIDCEGSN